MGVYEKPIASNAKALQGATRMPNRCSVLSRVRGGVTDWIKPFRTLESTDSLGGL